MSLLERLEAKRREVDIATKELTREHDSDDYLWFCDLRDVLDEVILTIHPLLMIVPSDFCECELDLRSDGIVWATKE